jgi:hypothetical protein
MRSLITVEEETPADGPEVRFVFLVTDIDGDDVYEPIKVIAADDDYTKQLWDLLQRDAKAFARKQIDTLAELRRLSGH